MTATLTLPDVHHVTGGEPIWDECDYTMCSTHRSPRSWWWPVPGEWEQNDSVGLHGTDEFGPPARLVALTEPCDECGGKGYEMVDGMYPHGQVLPQDCPDCHNGKRIVQLVQGCGPCADFGDDDVVFVCWQCQDDGTVPVARVTITLATFHPDNDLIDLGLPYEGPLPVLINDPHGNTLWVTKATADEYRGTPLPFKVRPGKTWVARAEEIPS